MEVMKFAGRHRVSCWAQRLVSIGLLTSAAACNGAPELFVENGEGGAGGESSPDIEVPDEVSLVFDDEGSFGPTKFDFEGSASSSAGEDSEIQLSFLDGGICLAGETGQVQNNDWPTFWGAEATFNLCEGKDGRARPVSECVEGGALRQLVGLSIKVEGEVVPWMYRIRFNEAGREVPAELRIQDDGTIYAFLSRAADPRDAGASPIDPNSLTSISIRASGYLDEPLPFDFCAKDVKLLFGDEWKEVEVPDWIKEPGPGQQVDYVGVNLVGAEFGDQNLPGNYGSDYLYPSEDELDIYTRRGMNIFRVPFKWERLQRKLYDELNADELALLKETIAFAKVRGATVIVDPHNFARYESDGDTLVVGEDLENEAFADFWSKLAKEFKDNKLVWFGLMNEPHSIETEGWLESANAAIAAIRKEGAKNKILVPGNQWTGAHAWFENYYGTPNAEIMTGVDDPGDNFAIELHQYFDEDSSGTHDECVSADVGVNYVQDVTDWLRDQGLQGFLGEFGGSEQDECLHAMDNLLNHLGDNSDIWLGWAVWASTPWNIQHNVRPLNDEDVLQMRVLRRHMDSE